MQLYGLFKKNLTQEMKQWVSKGLVSKEQAQAIAGLYSIDLESESSAYSLLIRLGYLFIGLSLITLIGANWDDIPRALRMGVLLLITLGTHSFALKKYLGGQQSAGVSLFMLGNLFFGASIILIAQIYHLGEHMPDGVFWWALGSLPFALILRNSWLMLFSALLALLWFFLESGMGFFPVLFPIFLLPSGYILIKEQTNTVLFLCFLVSLFVWFQGGLAYIWTLGRFLYIPEQAFVGLALFCLLLASGAYLKSLSSYKAKGYGQQLISWLTPLAIICMMVLSFEDPWRELLRNTWYLTTSMWWLIAGILACSVILLYRAKQLDKFLSIILFFTLTIYSVVLLVPVESAIYYQVLYNLALIVVGIYLLFDGLKSGDSQSFFLGLSTILMTAVLRYFDLIGDYIGGAILFFVMALILIGAAKFWQRHQALEVQS